MLEASDRRAPRTEASSRVSWISSVGVGRGDRVMYFTFLDHLCVVRISPHAPMVVSICTAWDGAVRVVVSSLRELFPASWIVAFLFHDEGLYILSCMLYKEKKERREI